MATIDKIKSRFSAKRAAFLKTYLPICLILVMFGCGNPPEDGEYKAFYFPYEELTEGLVYEYEAVNGGDSLQTEYWFYKSLENENGWHLTGTYYDSYFQVRQFFREKMHPSGSVMVDYFIYQPDSAGTSKRFEAELKATNGFPFELKDTSSILLFDLQWTFSEDPVHRIGLTKNRQYRERSIFSFQGNRLPAVIFDLRERVDDERDGHLIQEYTGLEIYAKDIGLVYYRKDLNQNIVLEYQLKDIYEMAKFEEKFKVKLH